MPLIVRVNAGSRLPGLLRCDQNNKAYLLLPSQNADCQPFQTTVHAKETTDCHADVADMHVAILAAIALPSYERYVLRGKRAAARAQMIDIANREQQYFLANRAYADKAALDAGGYSLPSEVAAGYGYLIAVWNSHS